MTISRYLPLATLVLATAIACDAKPDATATAGAVQAGPKYIPALTKELVAPAAKGMVVGSSTRKEFDAAFPAAETIVDKRLGGTGKVEYNGAPATHVILAATATLLGGTAWFTHEADGTDRLQRLELRIKGTETCAWNTANLGKVEGTGRRPGSNRRFGGPSNYTAGTADGSMPVGIECNPADAEPIETLTYVVDDPSGGSMTMSREG